MLPKSFVPKIPFPEFKWVWASRECTEGINDPIILLGVLSRMYKYNGVEKYSSPAFARELEQLQDDVHDSVGRNVNLAGRGGERNIIRNSGQYWKAVGLLGDGKSGIISITPFGCQVASREISQTEFAAITIKTLELPNRNIQNPKECELWDKAGVKINPLVLILNIIERLGEGDRMEAYITPDELILIVIPLSCNPIMLDDYVQFILWNRKGQLDFSSWPNCCPRSNDRRMAREFLLFLYYYGYLSRETKSGVEYYWLVSDMMEGIKALESYPQNTPSTLHPVIRDVVVEIERKRVISYQLERPYQQIFRNNVLTRYESKCILTGIAMPEVLQAAHIVPIEYSGNDSVDNGLCMRVDIHRLFNLNHIRITPDGLVEVSNQVDREYGDDIIDKIKISSDTQAENLRWRWDNYTGL